MGAYWPRAAVGRDDCGKGEGSARPGKLCENWAYLIVERSVEGIRGRRLRESPEILGLSTGGARGLPQQDLPWGVLRSDAKSRDKVEHL